MTSEYDLAGRRTKLTWPDSFHVTYDHLITGETTAIRESGATSGIGVLATFGYDPLTVAGQLGQRTGIVFGNGNSTTYAYDPVSRLQQLKQDMEGAGTANDLTSTFAYNPAGQIVSTTRSNPGSGPGQADLYAFTGHGSGTTSTTSNGLNRSTRATTQARSRAGSAAATNMASGSEPAGQYAGQYWLGDAGLHYYRARAPTPLAALSSSFAHGASWTNAQILSGRRSQRKNPRRQRGIWYRIETYLSPFRIRYCCF